MNDKSENNEEIKKQIEALTGQLIGKGDYQRGQEIETEIPVIIGEIKENNTNIKGYLNQVNGNIEPIENYKKNYMKQRK